MALTKKQKQGVIDMYADFLAGDKDVVLVEQKKLTVNNVVAFKKEIANENVVAKVVKKRMFSQTAIKNGFDDNTLPTLSGSVLMMVTDKEDFAGLKVIQKMNKAFKKLENKPELSFLGGRYGKKRHDGGYVSELASIPTKPELVAKLLFLFKHPIQKFVGTLDAIASKDA